MTAQVIAVMNSKGGSGKTCTAMHLAANLGHRGKRVLVVDADSQATALAWSRAAPDERPFPAAVVGMASFADKMHREIQRQLGNYDYIIIDCPPSLEALTPTSALLISNLCIIPIPPSPADLWAARSVKLLIERLKMVNDGLLSVVLPTKVSRTSLSKAVLEELKNFGIPMLNSRLSNRTAFQESVLGGTSVCQMGRDARPAAIEVEEMTGEVLAILGGAQ